MSDNKDLKGQQDRDRVAGGEDYEVRYMAEKLGTSEEMIKMAIKEVGNSREKVEDFIKTMNNKK